MTSNISDRRSKIPTVEKTTDRIKVIFNDVAIAETTDPVLVLEPNLPPVYYIPQEDVKQEYLESSDRQTHCSWKGDAEYFHVVVNGKNAPNAAWRYSDPLKRFQKGRDHISFYPSKLDGCYVNGKQVTRRDEGKFAGWETERNTT